MPSGRADPLYKPSMRTSWLLYATTILLAACVPETPAAQNPDGAGSGSGSAVKKAPSGDVTFDVAPSELAGVQFTPTALGRPGIPTVKA